MYKIGSLPTGARNSIADVEGVRVGHCTVDTPDHKTGVTVVLPCAGDVYRDKLTAACHVLNGFGKTTGLIQIRELGTLETPIALTNTLNVGLVQDALVEYMCRQAEAADYQITTVNPVVCECNDSSLNNIRRRAVTQDHVFRAIETASADFALGDVGAGKGMTCFGLKGGIGTASRQMVLGGETFTLGVLALTNHGSMPDLILAGTPAGERIQRDLDQTARPDKGSCILIAATDLPLSSRQLGRVIRRGSVGLARMGSYIGHGSGEVFLGFTTAHRVREEAVFQTFRLLGEEQLDLPFRAMAEAAEEAVLRSMLEARAVTGFRGTCRHSLGEVWREE